MLDLNTLVPLNPDLQVTRALYINDRGEIAVQGNFSNGDIHAFVLIPCDENHSALEGCDYSLVDESMAAQSSAPSYAPSGTRYPPQSSRSNRYHVPGLKGSDR